MTRFVVGADCVSCGNEQSLVVKMPRDYSERDLRAALDECDHECDECGDLNWRMPVPEAIKVQP